MIVSPLSPAHIGSHQPIENAGSSLPHTTAVVTTRASPSPPGDSARPYCKRDAPALREGSPDPGAPDPTAPPAE